MRDVAVIGVGMTRFGKFLDKGIKDLVRESVEDALDDSGVGKEALQAAYVGNAAAGLMTGQEMIRGQVTLTSMGIEGIPIYNVENACAGSSTAFHLGWTAVASRYTTAPVWVAASVVGSGKTQGGEQTVTQRLAPRAYEVAGIGPGDVDVIEVHDATSPSEIISLIELGICPGEEASQWIDGGWLEINGKKASNPSGGLVTKGHPVGATGCGQIYEIVKQLKGQAGKRQVKDPRVGMTHNGGGIIGLDAASMTLHVFKR